MTDRVQEGAPSQPVLEARNLRLTYGKGANAVTAIGGATFSVMRGEFVSLVGPSGCGKTSLLRCLAGLLMPTAGDTLVQGSRVTHPPGDLAFVFQDYTRSLLPWYPVLKNVTFPLGAHGVSRDERIARGREALGEVGLTGFEGKYPWQLSGGMQQRVAIARAIAYQPAVLLMDEPFASVDAQVRMELEDLVLRIHGHTGMTILFVTHDIDEAVYLSTRVLVLTRRPARVHRAFDVPLRFPRDQLATRADPAFVDLRTEILSAVKASRVTDMDDPSSSLAGPS